MSTPEPVKYAVYIPHEKKYLAVQQYIDNHRLVSTMKMADTTSLLLDDTEIELLKHEMTEGHYVGTYNQIVNTMIAVLNALYIEFDELEFRKAKLENQQLVLI